ncbi:MAG: hypothetical protein COX06_02390 [Candidatus Zambryskibacteria bacterium CG22_combo_CG10-13_8_21_14_all_42_17]|uniref:DUF4149 domain-containing protein n=1 Tax=Candidatus Zambryskibacteria bacterium CG22_combo_CG10-13_8_21_14_all_42_17 TaxID=1975118 RepID=A0A2H0BDD7_9BACT|nr:MAG: hypothetical protein COX06_02390 [Candidatus Zambryskibacteria bacterium CG22_combo_CG10-13_8_21_14_all_42_17]
MDFFFNLNLIILALDHLITGGLALFFPVAAIKFYKIVFGANVPFTTGHLFILKPWGALGIFASLVGILPIFDPIRYEKILWALVLLLVFRIFIRSQNNKNAEIYLNISSWRNILHIGLIALCASVILIQIITL